MRTGHWIMLIALTFVPSHAMSSSWGQWRGDSERSGMFSGALDFTSPGVRWRSTAGGVLSNDFVVDVDGNNVSDLVTVEGGQLVARSIFGSVLWDTPNILAKAISGVMDVNADGVDELLVRRSNGLILVSLLSGDVLWESTLEQPLEQIGSLLWEDLNGNGTIELLMADQAMNASKPYLTGAVHVFSFDDGFEKTTPAFTTEEGTRDYEVGRSLVTGDLDGDGNREIVVTGKRAVYAYSGVDGGFLGSSDPEILQPTTFLGMSGLFLRDSNGDGLQELYVFTDADFVGEATRQVTVFSWVPETQSFALNWVQVVPDPLFGAHTWPAYPFIEGGLTKKSDDLISSSFVPGEGWTTRFYDVLSGQETEALEGMRALSVVNWDEARMSLLLSTSPVQETPVYQPMVVLRKGAEGWDSLGAIEGRVFLRENFEAGAFLMAVDEDGDGWGDAVERRSFPDLKLVERVDVDVLTMREGIADGEPVLLAYEPMGLLGMLSVKSLSLLNDADEDQIPDLQVGGYGVSRVVAEGTTVVHGRAGGRLAVIDGSTGSPVERPQEIAEFVGSLNQQPILFYSPLGLSVVVMTQEANSRVLQVKAYGIDGTPVWTSTLGGTGGVYGVNREILVEDLNGDGIDDLVLVVDESVQPSNHRVFGIDGSNGVALWLPKLVETPGGGIGQLTVDGETNTLMLTGNKVLYEWEADTGKLLRETTNQAGHYYGRASLIDLDGDGTREVILIGTHKGAIALNEDRSERWNVDMGSATRASGVLGRFDDQVYMGLAQFQSPIFWRIGVDGEVLGTSILAFGGVYEDLESAPPGAEKAFLREVLFAEDLTGEGDAAFLLTSSDGYLYALGIDGELLWAQSVGGAAGAPALFDADSDGESEILVPSQSGGIVALDQTSLVAPEWVHEVSSIGSSQDVDEQQDCDLMRLTWAPVIGATGYRIALYTTNGTFVSMHLSEGEETSTEIQGLSLSIGAGYYVRVSATIVNESGAVAGPDTQSDGVQVVDLSDPEVSFFTVSPFALVPSEGASVVTFSVSGSDEKGLKTYRISVRGEDGGLWQAWDGFIYAKTFELELVWDGRKENGEFAPGGLQTVRVELEDLAGKIVMEEREMFLCTSPNRYDPLKGICYPPAEEVDVEVEPESVSGPSGPSGNAVLTVGEDGDIPIGLPYPTTGGCSCQTVQGPTLIFSTSLGGVLFWMLLLWFRIGQRRKDKAMGTFK